MTLSLTCQTCSARLCTTSELQEMVSYHSRHYCDPECFANRIKVKPREWPWPEGPYVVSLDGNWRDENRKCVMWGEFGPAQQVMRLAPPLAEAAVKYYRYWDSRSPTKGVHPHSAGYEIFELGKQISKEIING